MGKEFIVAIGDADDAATPGPQAPTPDSGESGRTGVFATLRAWNSRWNDRARHNRRVAARVLGLTDESRRANNARRASAAVVVAGATGLGIREGRKARNLRAQARELAATDPQRAAELEAEAAAHRTRAWSSAMAGTSVVAFNAVVEGVQRHQARRR